MNAFTGVGCGIEGQEEIGCDEIGMEEIDWDLFVGFGES